MGGDRHEIGVQAVGREFDAVPPGGGGELEAIPRRVRRLARAEYQLMPPIVAALIRARPIVMAGRRVLSRDEFNIMSAPLLLWVAP